MFTLMSFKKEGFEYVGPFATMDELETYAREMKIERFLPVPLQKPRDLSLRIESTQKSIHDDVEKVIEEYNFDAPLITYEFEEAATRVADALDEKIRKGYVVRKENILNILRELHEETSETFWCNGALDTVNRTVDNVIADLVGDNVTLRTVEEPKI